MVFKQLGLCNYGLKASVLIPDLSDSDLHTFRITVARDLFYHFSVGMVVGTWMVSLLHTFFADTAICTIGAFAWGIPEYAGYKKTS